MAVFWKNFGLVVPSENYIHGLMQYIVQSGKPIAGYAGSSSFELTLGDVRLIVRTEDCQGYEPRLVGMDSLIPDSPVWQVRLSEENLKYKPSPRMIVTPPGKDSMAVVNLVKENVLPSLLPGDMISMQTVAFPTVVQYFADEEDYMQAQPQLPDGQSPFLEKGRVVSTGLSRGENPVGSYLEEDEPLNDTVHIRGTVLSLREGIYDRAGEIYRNSFIRCLIDTEFGPLEVVHTSHQVAEVQRYNIREGAVINFYGSLYGNVAIGDYENGLIRDEVRDLAALRYAFCGGDPERLRAILAPHAVYETHGGASFRGPDEIILHVQDISEHHPEKQSAHLATITRVDCGSSIPLCEEGKRCIVFTPDQAGVYTYFLLIHLDENGNILRIVTSADPRYRFIVDEAPEPPQPPSDSWSPPDCGTYLTDAEKETRSRSVKPAGDTDNISVGFYFQNALEFAIYCKLFGGDREILWLNSEPYLSLYKKGYQLAEEGQFREAIQVLNKSLTLNPIGISARFEMCECYIQLKELDKAQRILIDMSAYLLESKTIARFYRRMGYIEVERENYILAAACFLYSMRFENHLLCRKELAYITVLTRGGLRGKVKDPPAILEKHGVPVLTERTVDDIRPPR